MPTDHKPLIVTDAVINIAPISTPGATSARKQSIWRGPWVSLAKQLTFMRNANVAGIVLGARVPVILTSRADNRRTKLA